MLMVGATGLGSAGLGVLAAFRIPPYVPRAGSAQLGLQRDLAASWTVAILTSALLSYFLYERFGVGSLMIDRLIDRAYPCVEVRVHFVSFEVASV